MRRNIQLSRYDPVGIAIGTVIVADAGRVMVEVASVAPGSVAFELGIVALDREGERDDVRRHGGALAAQLLQTHHRVDELLRLRILGARRPA